MPRARAGSSGQWGTVPEREILEVARGKGRKLPGTSCLFPFVDLRDFSY
ncbi:hypothetical protein [Candidatus Contubernalis alkaliaceticus]|nr:hypothetical protein [Candidatus Contubernalis alkalaceticus]